MILRRGGFPPRVGRPRRRSRTRVGLIHASGTVLLDIARAALEDRAAASAARSIWPIRRPQGFVAVKRCSLLSERKKLAAERAGCGADPEIRELEAEHVIVVLVQRRRQLMFEQYTVKKGLQCVKGVVRPAGDRRRNRTVQVLD